jgi:short-subunit dehydrogenase
MSRNRPVTLITGASKGLGAALARELARQGHRLVLTARGASALQEVASDLAAQTDVLAIAGDVADPAHAERLVAASLERFGRVDTLVNNASTIGLSPMPALAEYPLDTLTEVFRVNTVAPLHLIRLVLPGMLARGSGTIVNISSDAAVQAYPGWGGYGASKAALEHLSRILAVELEDSGVRVLVVDPGDMDTELHRAAEPGVDLSSLPGPGPSARAIAHLIEHEQAPFARHAAQSFPLPVSGGR